MCTFFAHKKKRIEKKKKNLMVMITENTSYCKNSKNYLELKLELKP